jgi:AraC family transcriptional activator of pobA
LLTTEATATEVAHQLGFSDSAHFNRRFKETTGLTPRAYRLKFVAG